MIYIKEYKTEHGIIVAACDEELLGNIYSEGAIILDLEKYSGFYKGELLTEKTASERIIPEELHSANIVGKRSVEMCITKGVASQGDVMRVKGVPFLQIYRVEQ